jgi:hypothetical protein
VAAGNLEVNPQHISLIQINRNFIPKNYSLVAAIGSRSKPTFFSQHLCAIFSNLLQTSDSDHPRSPQLNEPDMSSEEILLSTAEDPWVF